MWEKFISNTGNSLSKHLLNYLHMCLVGDQRRTMLGKTKSYIITLKENIIFTWQGDTMVMKVVFPGRGTPNVLTSVISLTVGNLTTLFLIVGTALVLSPG